MAYIEVFCLLLFVISIFRLIKRPRIDSNEPPLVPYRYPIIGHTYDFLFNTENFLKECKEKYGDLFSIYILGSVKTIAGADCAPEVFKYDTFDFVTAIDKTFPMMTIFNHFVGNYSNSYVAQVVHEQIGSKLDIYTSRMQKELLFGIENIIGDCKEPKAFRNIKKVLTQIVAKPVANILFGEEAAQFKEFMNSITAVSNKSRWNPLSPYRDIFVQYYKPIVEERIRQRKKNGRPELCKEIYEEQLKIHNESNGNLSTKDVDKMVKLDSFLKKSVRHSAPIVELPHTNNGESFKFSSGTTIPKGREVFVYMKDVHFNPKYYGETSNDFQPKRHIISLSNSKIINSPIRKVDRTFIMFGGGKHACPGRAFAINEIKICFHKLILRYNIRTESGKIIPPERVGYLSLPSNSGLVFENRD
ncbi:1006_t:CDS:10 [Gigaspora margarita]|uniref:1006_t:CDS:1 n=1 Tax=Gigaspora margarita TaxID=4874 RepID=A0ABN7W9I9_GIGMA|nr:1006_t:CDS:10 [Gigaspora margarita]